MNPQILIDTASELLADDKGLLAMDESNPTCNKRFARLGIPQTIDARRAYRELIVTTPDLGECISGAILYDETIGDDTTTLRALISGYLFVSIFRACAESLASENASRLAAMQRADKNTDKLLEKLNGTFHRLRQSGIDEELFDVISGFEALSAEKK